MIVGKPGPVRRPGPDYADTDAVTDGVADD
jgi:hypothetical protein